jgi:hypothetical protein
LAAAFQTTLRPVTSGHGATPRMPSGVNVTPNLRTRLIGIDAVTTMMATASSTRNPDMR